LGAARWLRNLDDAKAESARTGKPIFLLFTEVPGCSTVKGFARHVLRHPLIVEAIESEFVPLVIYNNVGGHDREVLKTFAEPSWNNPVVRFIDHGGTELAPRFGGPYGERAEAAILEGMVRALKEAHRHVPAYLSLLSREQSAESRSAIFSMYCFWSGEVALAGLPGVISTRPGHAAGREVVEVRWDPRQTDLPRLLRAAKEAGAASGYVARTDRERRQAEKVFTDVALSSQILRFTARDDKYQLRGRAWRKVPMTPAQASCLNRAVVTAGESPRSCLSPRQAALPAQGRN